MSRTVIDQYLAACLQSVLVSAPLPAWPADWSPHEGDAVADRVRFHGIALCLANAPGALSSWPAGVAASVMDEARMQAMWEDSHRQAIMPLLDAFHAAGLTACVMKGTALAYSVYDDPASRRRSDTDIMLFGASRSAARGVLERCGFAPSGNPGPTQEPWELRSRTGFAHEVDIHWSLSSSIAVSRALEKMAPEQRVTALPRLSPAAMGLGPTDNLIMTCVNRLSHDTFGYFVADDRPKDGDRLIWALDIHLVTAGFDAAAWNELAALALTSGTAGPVRSGLLFAAEHLGVTPPAAVLDQLASPVHDQPVADYFGSSSSFERLQRDLTASSGLGEMLRFLAMRSLPDRRFMRQRYPDAEHWPLWALRVRRMAGAGLKLMGLGGR